MSSSANAICKESPPKDTDPDYQYLTEIQRSMDLTSSDYEYPVCLDTTTHPSDSTTTTSPSPPAQDTPHSSTSVHPPVQPIYQNVTLAASEPPPSTADDSDSDYVEAPHISIKQTASKKRRSTRNGSELENSSKIYVDGHLPDYLSTIETRARSVSQMDELVSSLSEQGIYQGLALTDNDKCELGIMPQSVYMAANLLENLGGDIERLNIVDEMTEDSTNGEEDAEHEAEEAVRTRLGSKTDPNVFKPKIRRGVMRASAPSSCSTAPRPVVPRYRNYVIRPPPLPPVSQQATLAERKAYSVMESLLKSEASLLSSLHIAIQVYMRPLKELSLGPSPILSQQQVETLFGPIEDILSGQELFYSALTSRTLAWNREQKIGDVFLSSLTTKAVIRCYSTYVNNFTAAISVLEEGLKKKVKLINFLKEKYRQSNTSLSLQGLLLKPIQRFPQYIMFIQDLLKYTAQDHPDRIILQMSLARFEGIAEYLNESKRATEQRSIVAYLSTRVAKLPFKLTDSTKRWLYRQDVVTRLFVNGPKLKLKKRFLLLFNNIVLCAAPQRRRTRQEELEGTTGSRLFRAIEGTYFCKWHVPVDSLHVLEPDYRNDIWDLFVDSESGLGPDNVEDYKLAKTSIRKLERDFTVMTKISSSVAKLHHDYQGLTTTDMNSHIRVLQRKLARAKEEVESYQAGRLDVSIPDRDGTNRVTHTYVFPSKKVKDIWINTLRYTKLKLNKSNKNAWVTSEDTNDEDFFDISHKLPLLVESYKLSMLHTLNSINCGTRVGPNSAWLASGSKTTAQVTIVECVTPAPLVLESFDVESSRIMTIVYVPPSATSDATLTATMKRVSLRDTLRNMGTLTNLPHNLATVWMGAECGKLSVYSSESMEDGTKKCLSSVKFGDAITSLQHYKDQVIVSTADGSITIFQRNSMGWNLAQRTTVSILDGAIRCTCVVKNRLWIAASNLCYFFNLQTQKVEGCVRMSNGGRVFVSKMVCWGEGVWVSFKGSSNLELYHTVTKNSLQSIDVKSTLHSIMKRRDLLDRHPVPDHVHVTALLLSSGYFWIGTSVGVTMVYRIPLIEGVPLITAKPYLAMDGHSGQVRVILTVKTQATISSLRVNEFLKAEQRDRHSTNLEEDLQFIQPPKGSSEAGETPSPEGTPPASANRGVLEDTVTSDVETDDVFVEDSSTLVRSATPSLPHPSTLVRSATPSLPHPSTLDLLDSTEILQGQDLYTPRGSSDEELDEFQSKDEAATAETRLLSDNDKTPTTQSDTIDGKPTAPANISTAELQTVASIPPKLIVDMIPPTAIEESHDYFEIPDSSELTGIPATEVSATTAPESSTISRETEAPVSRETEAPVSRETDAERTTSTATNRPVVHNLEDLQESEDTGQYAPLSADTLIAKKRSTIDAVEKHRADDIYLPTDESLTSLDSYGYHAPVELDALQEVRKKSQSDLDNPHMLRGQGSAAEEPSPYEDPSTLDNAGPDTASRVFSSTLVRNSQPTIPGRSKEKEGAIFVLTCGRGLIDLRSGIKTNVLFPTARTSSVSQETKGCMLAYELEQ